MNLSQNQNLQQLTIELSSAIQKCDETCLNSVSLRLTTGFFEGLGLVLFNQQLLICDSFGNVLFVQQISFTKFYSQIIRCAGHYYVVSEIDQHAYLFEINVKSNQFVFTQINSVQIASKPNQVGAYCDKLLFAKNNANFQCFSYDPKTNEIALYDSSSHFLFINIFDQLWIFKDQRSIGSKKFVLLDMRSQKCQRIENLIPCSCFGLIIMVDEFKQRQILFLSEQPIVLDQNQTDMFYSIYGYVLSMQIRQKVQQLFYDKLPQLLMRFNLRYGNLSFLELNIHQVVMLFYYQFDQIPSVSLIDKSIIFRNLNQAQPLTLLSYINDSHTDISKHKKLKVLIQNKQFLCPDIQHLLAESISIDDANNFDMLQLKILQQQQQLDSVMLLVQQLQEQNLQMNKKIISLSLNQMQDKDLQQDIPNISSDSLYEIQQLKIMVAQQQQQILLQKNQYQQVMSYVERRLETSEMNLDNVTNSVEASTTTRQPMIYSETQQFWKHKQEGDSDVGQQINNRPAQEHENTNKLVFVGLGQVNIDEYSQNADFFNFSSTK